MKEFQANGDWPSEGDHTWHASTTKEGSWKKLSDFRNDVEKFAASHPIYSIAACDDGKMINANCQLMAASLFKSVTGSFPKPCPGCEHSCFH